jgi:hypothetical protein
VFELGNIEVSNTRVCKSQGSLSKRFGHLEPQ